ncbi:7574_t:CDS:2 [Scutellospora calospora]|uniref:7574_t:CDS:1 n=1 Tax=Scutellospora calospora TaxID=85575 RepID=A0ACA9KCA1_9GLOM|nr:7574_t:CDS:2 [Scutellospora calospora]
MKAIYLSVFIIIAFTSCVYSHWIPRNINACYKLYEYINSIYSDKQFLSYSDVKACYESTPYNETNAIKYDLENLIGELRDGHTWIYSGNYHKYTFHQEGFSMYSVINKDDIQQIKVFNDINDPSIIDCQVVDIDGRPAIDVITEYASNYTYYSRDLNARFNSALASLTFGYGDFYIGRQLFTSRTQLPKNPSISYTLNCDNKISNITREWQVPINNNAKLITQYKSPYINGTSVGKANLIFDAFIARFYILQDFGVVLISTESIIDDNSELKYRFLSDIAIGFKLLADKGIEKIVLDLSNNYGGDVFVAHYINKLLFPNIQSFPVDQKINNVSTQIIKKISELETRIGDIFHYKSYISTSTNSSFNSIKDFIGNNLDTRVTSKAFFNYTTIYYGTLELPTPPTLPWTEKDIIILTNGICQSSCAMITQGLAEINVPTISVGGFPNTRFSFAACSGGAVKSTESFPYYFNLLKSLNSSFNSSLISSLSLPRTLNLQFPIVKAYSVKSPDEILDFSFRPADYQLYYDERRKIWYAIFSVIIAAGASTILGVRINHTHLCPGSGQSGLAFIDGTRPPKNIITSNKINTFEFIIIVNLIEDRELTIKFKKEAIAELHLKLYEIIDKHLTEFKKNAAAIF